MNCDLNLIVLSDIHLAHHRTPTELIVDNIIKSIPNSAAMDDVDMIIIPGDVFDMSVYLPGGNITIMRLVSHLLCISRMHNVKVRILEGTPSHDWKQSEMFNELALPMDDIKYVDKLSIEHFDDWDIDILYIPDEWKPEPDDVWKDVQHCLKENNLEKVDFTVMHGMFEYQFPAHLQLPSHRTSRYLKITKRYVFCGHVHKHSQYKHILVPGSFDRLCHGEEEAKGHLELKVFKDTSTGDQIKFVENVNAKRYVTVELTGLALEEAWTKLDEAVKDLPKDSDVRIASAKSDAIAVSMDFVREKYPAFTWTSKVTKETVELEDLLPDLRKQFKAISLTPETLLDVFMDRVRSSKHADKADAIEAMLKEYL